jgi:hypothetical protein
MRRVVNCSEGCFGWLIGWLTDRRSMHLPRRASCFHRSGQGPPKGSEQALLQGCCNRPRACSEAYTRLGASLPVLHPTQPLLPPTGSLPRPARAKALQRHGKLLISKRPEDTTSLLMDLCIPSLDDDISSSAGPGPSSTPGAEEGGRGASAAAADAKYVASVAEVAHLYQDRPTMLMVLCEFVLSSPSPPPNEQVRRDWVLRKGLNEFDRWPTLLLYSTLQRLCGCAVRVGLSRACCSCVDMAP